MTDHRKIQRCLFRLQLDPSFAARFFAGEEEALHGSGLVGEDLAMLRRADPRAVAADFEGRRRGQVLGNASSEYPLTLLAADRGVEPGQLLEGFPASAEFHAAVRSDGRLPYAFGDWAERFGRDNECRPVSALAAFERALAVARREVRSIRAPGPGELVLAPRAWLFEAPAGTLGQADALEGFRRGQGPAQVEPGETGMSTLGPGTETILILAGEPAAPEALAEVRPELLNDAAAKLLRFAQEPRNRADRADLAAQLGASPADLEQFAESLVADAVLLPG